MSCLKRWLSEQQRNSDLAFASFSTITSVVCYSTVYAFRKPFTVAEFEGKEWGETGLSLKTVLIISQIMGYSLSKFIGIAYIPSALNGTVSLHLIGLVAFAEGALILFGLLPMVAQPAALLLNGLPLGCVYGLILSYLEGRNGSDFTLSWLCISFIVSSGMVKDVGLVLLDNGVSEDWMPAATGALFVPPFLLSVFFLHQLPPPTELERSQRIERPAMGHRERVAFLRAVWPGLAGLFIGVVPLAVFRDFRDSYQREIFDESGCSLEPGLFTKSEIAVGFASVAVVSTTVLIGSDITGLAYAFILCVVGAVIVLIGTVAFYGTLNLGGLGFTIIVGVGAYITYVAYSSVLFERLIAFSKLSCTVAFPLQLLESFGYSAATGGYLAMEFSPIDSYLDFFRILGLLSSFCCIVGFSISALYFFYFFDPTASPVSMSEQDEGRERNARLLPETDDRSVAEDYDGTPASFTTEFDYRYTADSLSSPLLCTGSKTCST